MTIGDPISWYDAHADELARDYEAVPADQLHTWLAELVPADGGALVFDVGAGTGRDAAWLASKGHEVVAIEPSAAMRGQGQRRHPDHGIR